MEGGISTCTVQVSVHKYHIYYIVMEGGMSTCTVQVSVHKYHI